MHFLEWFNRIGSAFELIAAIGLVVGGQLIKSFWVSNQPHRSKSRRTCMDETSITRDSTIPGTVRSGRRQIVDRLSAATAGPGFAPARFVTQGRTLPALTFFRSASGVRLDERTNSTTQPRAILAFERMHMKYSGRLATGTQ